MFWRKEPLIIHAHMFKNAGSTLDWSLARCFGELFLDHRDDAGMMQGASYLSPFLSQHKDLKALSSHWIRFPLPKVAGLRILSMLLFRHPIERIRSVYQFERQQEPAQTPGSIKAKALCFRDYVEWQMTPMPGPAIKNYQTRYCSGAHLGDDLENKYQLALNTLASVTMFGLVDCYDESMLLFEDSLRPYFPEIDLSYIHQNRSQSNTLTQAQRVEQVLDELGPVADIALDNNRFDLLLFEKAKTLVGQRLQTIEGRAARLEEFRQRCAALAASTNSFEENSAQ